MSTRDRTPAPLRPGETAARVTICVFAKPPRPGVAKTRLAAAVGPVQAARLAEAFLADTWALVRSLPWADPVLAATEDDPGLHAAAPGAVLWPQGPGDLGERLEHVLQKALALGRPAIALGADAPGLPGTALASLLAALAEQDAAIGPCEDGGFYALALRRCPRGLLRDLPWSSDQTCEATVTRVGSMGLSIAVTEPWFDVDRAEDLDRLREGLARGTVCAPATARALARLDLRNPS